MSFKQMLFVILWLTGMIGVISTAWVALPVPAEEIPMPLLGVKLISLIQPTFLLLIAVFAGVNLAYEIGLSAPLAEALASSNEQPFLALKPQIIPGYCRWGYWMYRCEYELQLMVSLKIIANNIVYSTTLLEDKSVGKESDREAAPDAEIAVFMVCLALATTAMFLLLTASTWKQKKKVSTTQALDQIPCRNCQFFKENQYLKCAVHPAIVLTQQAIDCQDYKPLNKPNT